MAITVKIRLNAILKEYSPTKGQSSFQLSLPDESSIEDAVQELGIPRPRIGVATVNWKYAELSETLQDGDEVILFPQITGG